VIASANMPIPGKTRLGRLTWPARSRAGAAIAGLAAAVVLAGVTFSLPAFAAAAPMVTGVVNAASFTEKVARGSLATIFGTGFTASAPISASAVPLPTSLGGVSVRIGGVAAPILFVSATQINFQVPYEVPADTQTYIVVTSSGAASRQFPVTMANCAVGVFTYARTTQARDPIIVHGTTNQLVTASNPAEPGEIVVAYATGIGKVNGSPRTGAPVSGLMTAVDTPTVTVAGVPATVLFAGLTQGFAGLAQFNIRLPATISFGSHPIVIRFPGDSSPVVELAVHADVPMAIASASSLSFGSVMVGQTQEASLTLANSGYSDLKVNSLRVGGAGFTLVSAGGPSSIPPGGVQKVTVRFAAENAGWQGGTLTIESNDPGNPTTMVALSAVGLVPGSILSLFLSTVGGYHSEYSPYGTIDSTSYLFSKVIPSTKQWLVLDRDASYSYARATMELFQQGSQVYWVRNANKGDGAASCNLGEFDPATGKQIGGNLYLEHGCDVDHLGVVGNSIYFRSPAVFDLFCGYNNQGTDYCRFGELKVRTGSVTKTLLGRTDAHNQAAADLADHGTLYAVYHDREKATLQVWTRNLATGRLDTLLRSYSRINESLYKDWSFRINNGELYALTSREADSATLLWSTDLTLPQTSSTPLLLLHTFPASSGTFFRHFWNVDSGKAAILVRSPSIRNGVAVFDIPTKATEYYDVGANTSTTGVGPLMVPAP
jgi:uncharacterized protein (TIGR03437 family)